MEFLVTMTTTVPNGTPQDAVDEIRVREAARARELAGQGHLLRLWRPPLQPGEWRTFGLFAADDDGQLEKVLAAMPLRVWRSDEVTPLAPHPNDPAATAGAVLGSGSGSGAGPSRDAGADAVQPAVEFLTTFVVRIPQGTPDETAADTLAAEADRARELAEQGHLERLWKLPVERTEPDVPRALGLWLARDAADMLAILDSLPLDAWMDVETTPLTEHPSDPAIAGGKRRP
jgi:muconolactone delta-isomerase